MCFRHCGKGSVGRAGHGFIETVNLEILQSAEQQ